jgi:sugar-specific transcriptional regulator TrmB
LPVGNELKILTDLGLTYCQAKIYFALIQCEEATAKGLSDITKIAVHDIYRIVSKLEELGLVEKGLGRPKIYRAVPPDIGVNYLIQENVSKTNDAAIQAKLLVQKLCKEPKQDFRKNPTIYFDSSTSNSDKKES